MFHRYNNIDWASSDQTFRLNANSWLKSNRRIIFTHKSRSKLTVNAVNVFQSRKMEKKITVDSWMMEWSGRTPRAAFYFKPPLMRELRIRTSFRNSAIRCEKKNTECERLCKSDLHLLVRRWTSVRTRRRSQHWRIFKHLRLLPHLIGRKSIHQYTDTFYQS